MRNVLSKVPPNHRDWASAALKAIFAMESRESALAKAGTVAAEMESRKLKAAAGCLRKGHRGDDRLPFAGIPDGAPQDPHEQHDRTAEPGDPASHARRRQFPDGNSALMLICARIRYVTANEWSTRRYLDTCPGSMTTCRKPELIIVPWTGTTLSAQTFGHYPNGGANQQWSFKPVGQSLKSATVWYRPSSTQERVRVQWRVYGSPDTTGGMEMTQACGGWWKATVPSAGSTKVGLSFSYGSTTDDNGGKAV